MNGCVIYLNQNERETYCVLNCIIVISASSKKAWNCYTAASSSPRSTRTSAWPWARLQMKSDLSQPNEYAMRALATDPRNPIALKNLGAILGKEFTML